MLMVNQLIGFAAGGDVAFPAISNLYARYKFDATNTTGGSAIDQANDLSGNARHITQGTAGAKPTLSSAAFNGQDCADFDGGDFLSRTQALSQPYHIFIVFIADTWTAGDAVFAGRDSAVDPTDIRISQSGTSPQIKQIGSGTGNTVSPTLGNRTLLQSFWSGASSFQAINNDSSATGTNAGTDSTTHFIAGAHGLGAGGGFDGKIAEIVICSAEKTGSDLAALKAYFAAMYAYG